MVYFTDYQFPSIASFLLFFATIGYWSSFIFPNQKSLSLLSKIFVIFSNFLFFLTLSSRWLIHHYFPLSNLYESLIFLSWSISFIQIYLERQTKSRLIGSIGTPLIFFISSFSSLTLPIEMQKASPLVPSLQSNWLMMHVSMMMVSYATLIIGSLLCIFYLSIAFFIQNSYFSVSNNFGNSQDSTLQKFFNPSNLSSSISNLSQTSSKFLELIDVWSYRIIGLGFPFLTLGIISGAVWANEAWGSYWSWDPKETWAFITWLVFASYLHSRLLKGWQGIKTAIIGSIGFFVIWICYLGVNFLGKGLHSYGWILESLN
jgi:cytochrome c-type biogenesis protein CcsB